MKTILLSLLMVWGSLVARSETTESAAKLYLSYLFQTKDGLVGADEGKVWLSTDGEQFTLKGQVDGVLQGAVLAGDRLVLKTHKSVEVVFMADSWRVETAPIADAAGLTSLASGGGEALVMSPRFSSRLGTDGKWSSVEHKIPDRLNGVAYANGTWVAVGMKPPTPEDPPGDVPTAIALWWSTDGAKWAPAGIDATLGSWEDPDVSRRGVFGFVANPDGFLAVTAYGTGLVSKDGRTWRSIQLPDLRMSYLVSVAGKFWLVNRNTHPQTLLSSTDGRKWTSVQLGNWTQLSCLAEIQGQATVYGKAGGAYGLVCLAEKPGEPAPKLGFAAAPKRVVPLPLAPATNSPVAAVSAALEKFDKAINGAGPVTFGASAQELLQILRANAGAHPQLPAVTIAIRDALADLLEFRSGLTVYHGFFSKQSPQEQSQLRARLAPAHQQVLDAWIRLLAQKNGGPNDASALSAAWPIQVRSVLGKVQSTDIELAKVYARMATGQRGAAVDLVMAHTNGDSVPNDVELQYFWSRVFNNLGGRIEKDTSEEYTLRLAQDGCAYIQFGLAESRTGKVGLAKASDQDLALYRQARDGGFRPAAAAVTEIEVGRKLAAFKATSESLVEGQRALRQAGIKPTPLDSPGTAKPSTPSLPVWKMPAHLAPTAAALAQFETAFNQATDHAAIGKPAAQFFTSLNDKVDPRIREAVLRGVATYVRDNAGVAGFLAMTEPLPEPVVQTIEKLLDANQRKLWLRARFAALGGALPADLLQAWPAAKRTRSARQGKNTMDHDHARARILEGDAGGALDLGLEYRNGWGVPADLDLFVLCFGIASQLDSKLGSLPKEPEAMIDALIAANSAQGRFMRATALLPKDQVLIPFGKARTLLEEAAQRGHVVAQMQLVLSGDAQVDEIMAAYDESVAEEAKAKRGNRQRLTPEDGWSRGKWSRFDGQKTNQQASASADMVDYTLQRGDLAGAQSFLKEARAANPTHYRVFVASAQLASIVNRPTDAEAALKAGLGQRPQYAPMHGLLALVLAQQRKFEAARDSAANALDIDPEQPEALLALAQLDASDRKLPDALAKLDRAIAGTQRDLNSLKVTRDAARMLRFQILGATGKATEAIQELETLCKDNPYQVQARQQLITHYAQQAGKPDEAWRHIRVMEELKLPQARQFRDELQLYLDGKSGKVR